MIEVNNQKEFFENAKFTDDGALVVNDEGGGGSGGSGGAAPENFRSGDWMCNNCRAHNFASRAACFKCSSKPS